MDKMNKNNYTIQERELRPASGILMLFLNIIALGLEVLFFFIGCGLAAAGSYLTILGIALIFICVIFFIISCILFGGLKTVKPNEAMVLTLFGKYVGTLKGDGFFWVNPFCTAFNPASGTKL